MKQCNKKPDGVSHNIIREPLACEVGGFCFIVSLFLLVFCVCFWGKKGGENLYYIN